MSTPTNNITEADVAAFLRRATTDFSGHIKGNVFASVNDTGIVTVTAFPPGMAMMQGQGSTVAEAISACNRALVNKPRIEFLRAEIKKLEAAA